MINHPEIFAREAGLTNGTLRLLSFYADHSAFLRARWAAGVIAQLAGSQWQTTSEMWKICSLTTSQPINEMISNDAANADVILVAISLLDQRAVELMEWLDSMASREPKRSAPGLLIGLLGDEENKSQELGWTVKQLIRCAQLNWQTGISSGVGWKQAPQQIPPG